MVRARSSETGSEAGTGNLHDAARNQSPLQFLNEIVLPWDCTTMLLHLIRAFGMVQLEAVASSRVQGPDCLDENALVWDDFD